MAHFNRSSPILRRLLSTSPLIRCWSSQPQSPFYVIMSLNPSTIPPGGTDAIAEPLASGLRYRRPGVLRMFNGLPAPQEETLEPSYALTPLPNPITLPSVQSERLFINITVNRVCRLFSILGLGFGGGWSCFPDEKRVPTSITWVIFIVILTDWLIYTSSFRSWHRLMFRSISSRIAVTALLDCLWPTAMNWYFRSPLRAKFLYTSSNNPPAPVKISLYRLGTTFVVLGYLLARVIKREDDQFMSIIEYIAGGLGVWYAFFQRFLFDDYAEILGSSLWAGWAESDNRGMKWLFQDDYREVVFAIFQSMRSFLDRCSYHVDVFLSYSGWPLPSCSR